MIEKYNFDDTSSLFLFKNYNKKILVCVEQLNIITFYEHIFLQHSSIFSLSLKATTPHNPKAFAVINRVRFRM